MYTTILAAHSAWRWVVLLTGLFALVRLIVGRVRLEAWQPRPAQAARWFVIAIDVQVVLGASLFLVFSPLTTEAAAVAGDLPSGSDLGFVSSYHAALMFGAFLLAHGGSMLIKRLKSDRAQYRGAILLYGSSLLLVIGAIPWWRPLLRF